MRWSEAFHVATQRTQSDAPITIIHGSGSYQDIYPDRFFIYPAGLGLAIRTARSSVVHHVLNEFDLNDDRWAVIPQKRTRSWLSLWTQWITGMRTIIQSKGQREDQPTRELRREEHQRSMGREARHEH